MNGDSFTDIFLSVRGRLTTVARRLLNRDEDIEDVLQDAFCRLWSRRESLHSEGEVVGMGIVTTRNLCLDNMRRAKEIPLDTLPEHVGDSEQEDLMVERERMYDSVEAIVNSRLTDTQRYIIEQHEYLGRSLNDIAGELGMSPPAVRMQVSRARRLIRSILTDENMTD